MSLDRDKATNEEKFWQLLVPPNITIHPTAYQFFLAFVDNTEELDIPISSDYYSLIDHFEMPSGSTLYVVRSVTVSEIDIIRNFNTHVAAMFSELDILAPPLLIEIDRPDSLTITPDFDYNSLEMAPSHPLSGSNESDKNWQTPSFTPASPRSDDGVMGGVNGEREEEEKHNEDDDTLNYLATDSPEPSPLPPPTPQLNSTASASATR